MAKKLKYVSLDFEAFLGDADFQLMNAEERGVYCSIILYLYSNNGRVPNDITKLRNLCNVNSHFDFQTVLRKFTIRRGFVTHKRVSAELARAQSRQHKAVMAANAKWNKQCSDDANAYAQAEIEQCQVKGSEVKRSNIKEKENKKKKKFIPPTLEAIKLYIQQNPELQNVNAEIFFKGFNDADPPWHDTRGQPVRNWKLKLYTWSRHTNGNSTSGTQNRSAGQRQKPERDFNEQQSSIGETINVD